MKPPVTVFKPNFYAVDRLYGTYCWP